MKTKLEQNPTCTTCRTPLSEENRTRHDTLTCPSCSREYRSENNISTDIIVSLNNANTRRNNHQFDESYDLYLNVLKKDEKNIEALWGLLLTEYGIVYVDESQKGNYIPTMNRFSDIPVQESVSYKHLMKNLKIGHKKKYYENEIDYIEKVRLKISDYVDKDESFDIFICYKKTITTDSGVFETPESRYAASIYRELTKAGYKDIFFAEETLKGKPGANWEALIYTALKTSKIMILMCTKDEYLKSPWVKNEWSRYLKEVEMYSPKRIIPITADGYDPSRLPLRISKFQAISMQDLQFKDNLIESLNRIIPIKLKSGIKKSKVNIIQNREIRVREPVKIITRTIGGKKVSEYKITPSIEQEIKNITSLFLERGKYRKAIKKYDIVLSSTPNAKEAIWGKILAIMEITTFKSLDIYKMDITKTFTEFEKLMDTLEDSENKYLKEYEILFAASLNNYKFNTKLYNFILSWKNESNQYNFSIDTYEIIRQILLQKNDNTNSKELKIFIQKNLHTILYEMNKFLPEDKTNVFINRYTTIAEYCVNLEYFDVAMKLLDNIYKIDKNNGPAKEIEFLILYKAKDYVDLREKINNLEFKNILESMLTTEFDILKQSEALFEASNNLLHAGKLKMSLKITETIMSYIAEGNEAFVRGKIVKYVELLIKYKYYKETKKYINHMLIENPKDAYFHWLNFKVSRGVKTELDLLLSTKKDLMDFPEFENALNSSTENKEYVDFYTLHDELYDRKDKTKKRIRKYFKKYQNELNSDYEMTTVSNYMRAVYPKQVNALDTVGKNIAKTKTSAFVTSLSSVFLASIGVFLATALYFVLLGNFRWIATYSYGNIISNIWVTSDLGLIIGGAIIILVIIATFINGEIVKDVGIYSGLIAGGVMGIIAYLIFTVFFAGILLILAMLFDLWLGFQLILSEYLQVSIAFGLVSLIYLLICSYQIKNWETKKYSSNYKGFLYGNIVFGIFTLIFGLILSLNLLGI